MKKLVIVLLAIFASGFAGSVSFAQTKVVAVEGIIDLIPDKVVIPSTNEYVYLAKLTTGGYGLFFSKTEELYERFSQKGTDSLIRLQGAIFKPLQYYTREQWRKLSDEIKIFFPQAAQDDLAGMEMYLLFNYSVEEKKVIVSVSSPAPAAKNSGNKKVGSDGLPIN